MIKEIKLTKGFVALVDDEDFEYLSQWKWYINRSKGGHIYAQRTEYLGTSEGKKKTRNIKMHRLLLKLEDKYLDVDHINGNTLDNRKENLRVASRSQNNYNSKKRNNKTSEAPVSNYKGVSYAFIYKPNGKKYIRSKPWKATGNLNKKSYSLGYFKTEKEAALAYNDFAIKYYGEFACLNDV